MPRTIDRPLESSHSLTYCLTRDPILAENLRGTEERLMDAARSGGFEWIGVTRQIIPLGQRGATIGFYLATSRNVSRREITEAFEEFATAIKPDSARLSIVDQHVTDQATLIKNLRERRDATLKWEESIPSLK